MNRPLSQDGQGFMQAERRKFDWLTLSPAPTYFLLTRQMHIRHLTKLNNCSYLLSYDPSNAYCHTGHLTFDQTNTNWTNNGNMLDWFHANVIGWHYHLLLLTFFWTVKCILPYWSFDQTVYIIISTALTYFLQTRPFKCISLIW